MKLSNTEAQCFKIANYLQKGKAITGLQALKWWGVGYLPARIADLKNKHDLQIDGQMVKVKKANGKIVSVKKYFLAA